MWCVLGESITVAKHRPHICSLLYGMVTVGMSPTFVGVGAHCWCCPNETTYRGGLSTRKLRCSLRGGIDFVAGREALSCDGED